MHLIRAAFLATVSLGLAACGTLGYQDTNAAVDARPECAGQDSDRPGEPVAPWCQREQAATWSSDSEGTPIDFSGQDD